MASNSTTLYTLPDGRIAVNVDQQNKTLVAADCGIVQNVLIDAITITLPASSAGLIYTIRNGGVPPTGGPVGARSDQSLAITIATNGTDGISGLAFTAATSKGAVNAKATSKVGDEIRLIGTGVTSNAAAWIVLNAKGTWARQA